MRVVESAQLTSGDNHMSRIWDIFPRHCSSDSRKTHRTGTHRGNRPVPERFRPRPSVFPSGQALGFATGSNVIEPDIRLREFLVRRGRTRSRRRSTSHSRPRTRVSSPPFGPSNRSPSAWTLIGRNLGRLARARESARRRAVRRSPFVGGGASDRSLNGGPMCPIRSQRGPTPALG